VGGIGAPKVNRRHPDVLHGSVSSVRILNRRHFLSAALLPAAAYCVCGERAFAAAAPSLVLVTSVKTSLDDISSGDLRQLFLGENIRDKRGQKLIPLNHQAGSDERTAFDARVLGMSQNEMSGYWIDQKVRGLKGPPRNLAPAQMVARVVEKFTGAVSYLRPEQLIPGLQMIKIDNIEPNTPGYRLSAKGQK
jgi:hypothetical protein